MSPELTRAAFRIGFFVSSLALVTLPFQQAGSAELYVTILAAVTGFLLAALAAAIARLSTRHPPPRRDKRQGDGL